MAAEMSTGAPAMVLVEGAPASVALILREVRARFDKRIVGPSTYTFADLAGHAGRDRAGGGRARARPLHGARDRADRGRDAGLDVRGHLVVQAPRMTAAVGFVVAGGRSLRMGRDKALLPWAGSTLLDDAIARMRLACPDVRILCGPSRATRIAACRS